MRIELSDSGCSGDSVSSYARFFSHYFNFDWKDLRAKFFGVLSVVAMSALLSNCTSGGGNGHTFTIGGTVSGLNGTGLVLQDDGGDNLTVTANGAFTFATPVPERGMYAVTVLTQPSNPAQNCVVTRGSGTVKENVNTVAVACTNVTATYSIGGTVSGLNGAGLVLQDNGGDSLSVTANGSFTFATKISSGAAYNVTIQTQPTGPAQNCVVSAGSGTATANVTSVQVVCTNITYTIGGSVSGLTGTGLVLQDNGGSNLSVTANGSFTFANSVASGAAYAVTVHTQPTNPAQTCTVTNGIGTATANVTNVSVACTSAPTYSVGGTVSGLSGTGLVLQDNGGDNLSVTANGSFTFATKLASGAAYAVTVHTQPTSPAQTCVVTNGSGTVASANLTAVTVACTTTAFSIGGTVSGLSGTGLVLQDNGGDSLSVAANGSFTFATKVASGSAYAVTVHTQPASPAQTCVVTNGSGTVGSANVTNVSIACTTNTTSFSIGGSVSGLAGSGLVLQDNGGDNLAISANGTFTFATKVASGSAYAVTVHAQPALPTQSCVATNAGGTVASANVTNVTVTCTTTTFSVGGTVSGLSGTGLVLQDNGGDNLAVTANGSFTFATKVDSGAAYDVTVHTEPSSPAQTCTVTGATGTVGGANVTNVTVACTTTTVSYTIGGMVSGLSGTGLVLQDNGGDSLSVSANGSFTFATKIASGSKYAITVETQPSSPAQNCVVANGTGTVSGANITNATVTCTDVASNSNIAVIVSGLLPNTSIALQDNGADNLTVGQNNHTTNFATAVPSGDPYAVTILTQPVGRTCTLSANASGTATGSTITVTVTCSILIAGGEQFTCAVNTAGAVYCWGLNSNGQLGNGTETRSFVPVPVTGLSSGVVQITAGQQFACALTSAGAVMCWGANSDGQLGNGTKTDSDVPVQVATLTSGVAAISAGHYHVCAILTSGGAVCWGDNGEGELGNGGAVYTGVADVTGLSSGVGEITSGSYYTCAVTTTTASMCWGEGGLGQLGAGSATTGTTTPIASLDPAGTAPLTNILTTAAGFDSTCAVVNDGTVLCWGDNSAGELGFGSVAVGQSDLPVQVVSTSGSGTLNDILSLGTGENFTCGVNTTGGVVCWGSNSSGQLGFSGTTFYDHPVQTQNLTSGAIGITAGYHHACAITTTGTVLCWGSNSTGQLGNGTTTDSTTPVTVVGASGTGTFQIF